ncbi:MAG: glycosyltransferase [Candidatus Dojkabacteria bacterium]|nr:glycosyltransferase [Candidatus Dojkabacteria bacterium]
MHFSIISPPKSEITFVVTLKDEKIYNENIIESTKKYKDKIEYITLYNNYSASTSLNTGLELTSNNTVVLCHQDIYFLDNWYEILKGHLEYLNKNKLKWGICGFAGSTLEGKMVGTHSGLSMNNKDIIPVQTLDGSVLILQKSICKENELKFDEKLRYFHMYDIDICLQSHEKGLDVYCLNVPIEHRSYRTTGGWFKESLDYVQEKWKYKVGIINSTVGNYPTNY